MAERKTGIFLGHTKGERCANPARFDSIPPFRLCLIFMFSKSIHSYLPIFNVNLTKDNRIRPIWDLAKLAAKCKAKFTSGQLGPPFLSPRSAATMFSTTLPYSTSVLSASLFSPCFLLRCSVCCPVSSASLFSSCVVSLFSSCVVWLPVLILCSLPVFLLYWLPPCHAYFPHCFGKKSFMSIWKRQICFKTGISPAR